MGATTGIEWTQHTWNPWRGCTKVSPGCANCYMFTEQRRYGKDPTQVIRTKTWGDPLKWQRAAEAAGRKEMVFTCSWSDWFHEGADAWRDEAWDVVRRCPNLIFQILTKRPERMHNCIYSMTDTLGGIITGGHFPDDFPNVWLGVSVEDQQRANERIPLLLQTAAVRFLSCEPLLGPVDLGEYLPPEDGTKVRDGEGEIIASPNWIIAGGESGPGARPCDVAWIRSIVQQCQAAGVAVFVKQLGSMPYVDHSPEPAASIARKHGVGPLVAEFLKLRDRKGRDMDEWPADLRVRQFPEPKVNA
jgi:protein gp37